MHIGILQTGESPDALRADMGDYPDFFETLLAGRGLTFSRYAVLRNEFPKDIHACDGWLITGSRFGAYEDHPFIPPLEDFIRQAYAAACAGRRRLLWPSDHRASPGRQGRKI
jgi:GMP synthase-like glutamine amidotransferase